MTTYLLCVFGHLPHPKRDRLPRCTPSRPPSFAWRFLVFIVAATVLSAALLITRVKDLRSENELEAWSPANPASCSTTCCCSPPASRWLWGTLFPVLSEAVQGEQITVGGALLQPVNVPLGLGLLLMTGVGPLLACRRSSMDSLRRNFTLPTIAGIGTGALLVLLGMRHPYAVLCFAMGAFVFVTIGYEFHRGVRARRAHRGGSYPTALVDLVQRNTRRYGGYIVHIGIVPALHRLRGERVQQGRHRRPQPRESTRIGPWSVTLQDLPGGTTRSMTGSGRRSCSRNTTSRSASSSRAASSTRPPGRPPPRCAARTFQEDIYLVFSGMTEDGAGYRPRVPEPAGPLGVARRVRDVPRHRAHPDPEPLAHPPGSRHVAAPQGAALEAA